MDLNVACKKTLLEM